MYLCRLNPTKPMPMQYPLISEYITSIVNAEDNFATMTDLRPVLHDDGTPVMSSGNFAVVFKMKDERDGKLYAVKCFTREQEERAENYRMISEELGKVSSPYITPVKWLDGELFVDTTQTDDTEFPVLLMDWIEGPTLSAFLQSIADQLKAGKVFKDNEYEMFELRCLPANFLRMASWLLKQPFAHGDLKPDNIIVQEDGYCVLVDYDGMYVPAMQGMPQTCMSTPNFSHPSQAEHTLNKDIDSYAIAVIALSLQAFAIRPDLIGESPDFCVITKQQALKLHTVNLLDDEDLMADNNIQELLSLFLHTLSQNKLDAEYFDKAIAEILVPKGFDIYNTEATDEDLESCYEDRFYVRYSMDGRRLLGYRYFNSPPFRIREGILSICAHALRPIFSPSNKLKRVFLPDSVLSIGSAAFANNRGLTICNIPRSVIHIEDDNPWGGCIDIKQMSCNSKHFIIKDGILYSADYRIVYGLIYFHSDIIIDKRTKLIAAEAFKDHRSLQHISIPDSVTSIGYDAFSGCSSLQRVTIPNSVASIESAVFYECSCLHDVTIPDSITSIGTCAFCECFSLEKVTIPDSVTNIGDSAFSECHSLKEIKIPDSVTNIGDFAFHGCSSLKEIKIPDSVTSIGNDAFSGCSSLEEIKIPDSVSRKKAYKGLSFAGCSSLKEIKIPDTVASIEDFAFYGCDSLKEIKIPDSVTSIGKEAFSGCSSLTEIEIPDSVTSIGEEAFSGCSSLTEIMISDSVSSIGDGAFSCCISLKKIFVPLNDIYRFKAMLPDYVHIITPIP